MSFNLKKFFGDVFSPDAEEMVTVIIDLPGSQIEDTAEWEQRRTMAGEWHQQIAAFSADYQIKVNPLVSF